MSRLNEASVLSCGLTVVDRIGLGSGESCSRCAILSVVADTGGGCVALFFQAWNQRAKRRSPSPPVQSAKRPRPEVS